MDGVPSVNMETEEKEAHTQGDAQGFISNILHLKYRGQPSGSKDLHPVGKVEVGKVEFEIISTLVEAETRKVDVITGSGKYTNHFV